METVRRGSLNVGSRRKEPVKRGESYHPISFEEMIFAE